MLHFVKAIIVVLAITAVVLPMAATSACHDAHDDVHATDCPCACCSTPVTDGHGMLGVEIALIAQRTVLPDFHCLELFLVTDIFRPPAST
ncbi:MAG TPA: hypothetical protein DCZ95_06700 [Verrucomicrobia bacterium]|nr:MAG: hypothetical protein A2X46_10575 [Lentisphaerae bacterium GWF2_57_35]HBA83767.1 hypothetical protein [Verrucomicrobiota bacterium]